jgi:lipase maturation factor 1
LNIFGNHSVHSPESRQAAKTKLIEVLRAPGSFGLTDSLFLRFLGLIYFSAFASLLPQIQGLVGARGIVPAAGLMASAQTQLSGSAFFYLPTLFWFNSSDLALLIACALGCTVSLLLTCAIFTRAAAIACFVLYLSLTAIGEPFTSFQWDALLLESGFLAIFAGAPWLVWGYRLLLFRLMFESGWVKLASHDPNWRNLHALRFHFMTQPLPNPVSFYAYRLPAPILDTLTFLTLAIELGAPFLLFAPRIPRYIGVGLLASLQCMILLTGNYAFFNLLALALCVWALDDRLWTPLDRLLCWRFPHRIPVFSRLGFRIAANGFVMILLLLGTFQLIDAVVPSAAFSRPLSIVQPFEIINSYGLFAVMTTTRPEIILEGSNDQIEWREYQFPYKPGNTHRSLPWIAPYQPRLDWQMWFAALGSYQTNTWVGGLMYRILTGEPSVYRLLSTPPFQHPPRYLRALLYSYDFTTPSERARSGAVWQRRLLSVWFGPASLNGQ